jgi:hypothetical protein
MDADEPAMSDAVGDGIAVEPGGDELCAGDHAVLLRADTSELVVGCDELC